MGRLSTTSHSVNKDVNKSVSVAFLILLSLQNVKLWPNWSCCNGAQSPMVDVIVVCRYAGGVNLQLC